MRRCSGQRQPAHRLALVGGLAEQVERHDVGAAAGRDVDLVGEAALAEVGADVDAAVADADDDHLLAAHVHGIEGIDVVVRVHLDAVELPGKRGSGQRGSQ